MPEENAVSEFSRVCMAGRNPDWKSEGRVLLRTSRDGDDIWVKIGEEGGGRENSVCQSMLYFQVGVGGGALIYPQLPVEIVVRCAGKYSPSSSSSTTRRSLPLIPSVVNFLVHDRNRVVRVAEYVTLDLSRLFLFLSFSLPRGACQIALRSANNLLCYERSCVSWCARMK